MDNKLPPANLEAEEAILGAILFDPKAITIVKDLVPKSKAFYTTANRVIYEACLELNADGKFTDLIHVSTYLTDHDLIEKVGGMAKLSQLLNRTISSSNVDRYCKIVTEKSLSRDLIQAGHQIVDLGYDQTEEVEIAIAESQQKLEEVASSNFGSEVQPLPEVSMNAFDELSNTDPIYETGLNDLDKMMVGFEPGTLTVLAGRPSMGKSAVALNFAFKHALVHKLPVTFFSLEMTSKQLAHRLWSLVSAQPCYSHLVEPVSGDDIRNHRAKRKLFTAEELENIAKIVGILAEDLPIGMNDDRGMTVAGIGANLRARKNKEGKLGLVVVDYLQMMSSSGSEQNRAYELGEIARGLYKLASQLDVPILALSQVNRACEARNDKRPMMSDLSQSGILEMVADNIMFCYRDEYYNGETHDNNVLELILRKARHGHTGTVKAHFNRDYGLIQDLY